jgi:hypothetical protein
METIKHYFVPADKIGRVLCYMKPYGWVSDDAFGQGQEIDKWYCHATSMDWDGHICIFRLREYKNKNKVAITSDLLMKANNQIADILPFEALKKKLNIQ